MKTISIFKVSSDDGSLPSMEVLADFRDALLEAAKDEFPKIVIGGFKVTKEDFQVEDGADIVIAPDVPLKITRRRNEIIETTAEREDGSIAGKIGPLHAKDCPQGGPPRAEGYCCDVSEKFAKLNPDQMKGAEDGFGGSDYP